jgi:hypothetical protein
VTVDRVSASRPISSSPQAIFAIVSNPRGHVEIDGSGVIQVASDPRPLTSVGETFDMETDRPAVIPGAPRYSGGKYFCCIRRICSMYSVRHGALSAAGRAASSRHHASMTAKLPSRLMVFSSSHAV